MTDDDKPPVWMENLDKALSATAKLRADSDIEAVKVLEGEVFVIGDPSIDVCGILDRYAADYLRTFYTHNAVAAEIESPQAVERKNGDGWLEDENFWTARCVMKLIEDGMKERGLVITRAQS